MRGEFATLVIRPKLPADRSLTGAPNTTRLKGFDISVRNCKVARSVNRVSLKTPKDSDLKPGCRVFRNTGALPKAKGAGAANAVRFRNELTLVSNPLFATKIGSPVRFGRTTFYERARRKLRNALADSGDSYPIHLRG